MGVDEFFGHDTAAMLRMLDNPGSCWAPQAGSREAVLQRSLKKAVEWPRNTLGPSTAEWRRGRIHPVPFPHAKGMQKPLDLVFNRGPLPIGGDTDTPCQPAMLHQVPYDNKAWAPSLRQIVNMGDLSRCQVIIPPGQSGRLGSAHYVGLAEFWIRGKVRPKLWAWERIEREAEGRL